MTSTVTITIRQISQWPWPTRTERWRSQFKAFWGDTEDLLKRELFYLGAKDAILEVDVNDRDLRHDGFIRADSRPATPRVALYFEGRDVGPLQYHCDSYPTWQENVRGIAKALEALRAVDRYGVTSKSEQYAGWKTLPSGDPTTPEQAAAVIVDFSGVAGPTDILRDAVLSLRAVRRAMMATHPDKGGNPSSFHRVQAARKILETHHAGAR